MPPPKTRRPNRHLYRPTSPPHATYAASAQFISPRPPHANLPHRHRVARWIVGPGPVQAFPPRGRPHITGYRRPKPVKSDTRTTVSRDNNPALRLSTAPSGSTGAPSAGHPSAGSATAPRSGWQLIRNMARWLSNLSLRSPIWTESGRLCSPYELSILRLLGFVITDRITSSSPPGQSAPRRPKLPSR